MKDKYALYLSLFLLLSFSVYSAFSEDFVSGVIIFILGLLVISLTVVLIRSLRLTESKQKKERPNPPSPQDMREMISAIGILLFISSPCLIIYQCFLWLKDGYWTSFSILSLLNLVPGNIGYWSYSPLTWIGFHRMIGGTPLSLFLLILGILIVLFGFSSKKK